MSFNEVQHFFWSTAKITWRHIPSILGPLKDGTFCYHQCVLENNSFDFVEGVNARAESHGHLEMLKKYFWLVQNSLILPTNIEH